MKYATSCSCETLATSLERMNNKHDIETYSKLESAANYFLKSAFLSLENVMKEESTGLIITGSRF
jgi:hypothetical protein